MATVQDLVLVHVNEKPGFYARIEDISPDVKPGWWQVRLLVLTFPLQVFTWILDEYQIEGAPFTMGGTPLRLEELTFPYQNTETPQEETGGENPQPNESKNGQKIVSLMDRRKK